MATMNYHYFYERLYLECNKCVELCTHGSTVALPCILTFHDENLLVIMR